MVAARTGKIIDAILWTPIVLLILAAIPYLVPMNGLGSLELIIALPAAFFISLLVAYKTRLSFIDLGKRAGLLPIISDWRIHILAIILFFTSIPDADGVAELFGILTGAYLFAFIIFKLGASVRAFVQGLRADSPPDAD